MSNNIKISKIKNNPNNPRNIEKNKYLKLLNSIKEFPEMMSKRPMVCVTDKEDGKIYPLGGNMRLKALKELEYKEIPNEWIVMADDWDEEKRKEFIVKDNLNYGDWDLDILDKMYDFKLLDDWGIDLGVQEEPEIINLDDIQEDGFEIPSEIKTDIVHGDLFEIGEHRLICGDTTKIDDLKKLFVDSFSDLVVTDPPYNVDYKGGTKKALTIKNDSMRKDDFYKFLYDSFTAINAFVKNGGSWYVWHSDSEVGNFINAINDSGIMVKQCLVWVKNNMVLGRRDYHSKHEPCFYGWKEGAPHSWYSDRKQTTVLEFDRPRINKEHPTMKPVGLIAYQIANSSKIGDIVADGFGGSGTTMVACHNLKRKCYMVELDPKYCQVIIDRMLKIDPQIKILKNGKEYKQNSNG